MSFAEMLQTLLPVVDDVYERWTTDSQQLTSALPAEVGISCKKGCGACCHFPTVPVTMGEAFVLFNHLLVAGYSISMLQALFVANYATRYLELAREMGALPFDNSRIQKFMKAGLPCPLFEKTPTAKNPMSGHCGAFSVRPLICDYFHSVDSPTACARHEPHGTLTHLIERGVGAVDELREFERKTFGWSVLMHLPLALAVLCTQSGLELVVGTRGAAHAHEDAQAMYEFELFAKMLALLGYPIGEADLQALAAAQQALT